MLHSHLTTLNAVSLILQVFQEDGVDAQHMLAGSGIGPADLGHADARITTQQELQVCANAVSRRQDIGLELGRRMHVSCYGMLGYALLSSATLGDALRLALQYPALLGTVFKLRLIDDGQRVWFSASDYHDSPALSAFNAEFCMVSLKVICDDLLGRTLPLLAARFEHPRPGYHAPGLEGLARQMNCSSRTLRRHLQALGSSYQQLLDELRFERAKQLLADEQMPIYRIAETLGFSETASFRHAFQRWSGVAPSHFRG